MGRPTDNPKPHQMTVKFDDECKNIIEQPVLHFFMNGEALDDSFCIIHIDKICVASSNDAGFCQNRILELDALDAWPCEIG